ncbi:uncharacterized protein LOC126601304 isoform X1 [Malus sylvestris]|uniref:uncharacterized protein LOC126601304 isoform X1 n=1 Tax=Malus sylvestris TaxID=3752 RepID=UPI0007ED1243|nr:uncharacterized protein LOC103401967 isoform X1 [Malus domestica]XP_050123951.1 uncharacterized protein LOC126601304 isoform X1 [Malus sylvestris]
MTTSSKGNNNASSVVQVQEQAAGSHECCMCGDFGFSYELFVCKVCQFRSQHRFPMCRYCSNLYPNAESYRICNWCLTQKEDTQNSSNSSSSCKKESQDQDHPITKISIKKKISSKNSHNPYGGCLRGTMQLQPSGPIKKQRSLDLHHLHRQSSAVSPSPSPSPKSAPVVTRKRIITNAAKEAERIKRTRSEDISNIKNTSTIGITRQVFRNKVRRYKLLDEVSSQ